MPSKESQALTDLFGNLASRTAADPQMDLQSRRSLLEELHTPAAEPTDITYEEVKCPGTVRPAIWCKPLASSSSHAILYFHGGGFVTGSPSSHRKLAGHLAKAAGCHALVIDYRLAPENPFPAALEDAAAAYKWLIQRGISEKHIATAGDSAGGNLAVAAVLKYRELGLQLPGAVVSFSPWVDMEANGETLTSNAKTDVLVQREGLVLLIKAYLGGASAQDPLANPLYADLKGLPPMYITAGKWETLLDNAERLAERARKAGVPVELELSEAMQHVYVFMAGNAPEADKSINDIGVWLRQKLGVKASQL